jgi:hypothetical protein
MRNQINIDEAFSRAIIREIGECLRTCPSEAELPASLKDQLDRINQIDQQSSPTVVPEQEREKIDKAAVARKTLASPIWWTTRWRTRLRRARK